MKSYDHTTRQARPKIIDVEHACQIQRVDHLLQRIPCESCRLMADTIEASLQAKQSAERG